MGWYLDFDPSLASEEWDDGADAPRLPAWAPIRTAAAVVAAAVVAAAVATTTAATTTTLLFPH